MGDRRGKKYLGCTQCDDPRVDRRDVWTDESYIKHVTYVCECGAAMYITYHEGAPNVFETEWDRATMDDDYINAYVCPVCGSHNITLPADADGYPASAREAWGECLDCGTALGPMETHYVVNKIMSPEKVEAAVKSLNKHSLTGRRDVVTKPAIQNIKPEKKNPFGGCDARELGEIAVAVELLLEHPVTEEYVMKLQADLLEAAITAK